MSQAKVDRYKEEKKNRKKIMAQDKAKRIASIVCAWVIVIAVVAWAGISGYKYYQNNQPKKVVYTNLQGITEYLDGMSGEAE